MTPPTPESEVVTLEVLQRSELMATYSTNLSVEAKLMELFGPVVHAHLSDPRINELSSNFDPETGQCIMFADFGDGPERRIAGAALHPDIITGATRILTTEAGKSLNPKAPFLNMVLPNGFRYHAVLPPASDGASVSIRTHHRRAWKLTDFNMTPGQIALIEAGVREQQTILISGKTTVGKTSLANAILGLIPADVRLLIAEDEPELEIDTFGRNVTRRRATEDADFTVQVREALRDRPDYLILGEIRGDEAADILEAASLGHPGLSTIHASSVDEALKRLQRLAKCDRELVREAIDLVIQVVRMPDGKRVVSQIQAPKEGAI